MEREQTGRASHRAGCKGFSRRAANTHFSHATTFFQGFVERTLQRLMYGSDITFVSHEIPQVQWMAESWWHRRSTMPSQRATRGDC